MTSRGNNFNVFFSENQLTKFRAVSFSEAEILFSRLKYV